MWHHAENETWYDPFRLRYAAVLADAIASWRKDLHAADVPVIVVLPSCRAPWGARPIQDLTRSIVELKKSVHNIEFVDISDLPHGALTAPPPLPPLYQPCMACMFLSGRVVPGLDGTVAIGQLIASAISC